jgi:hypothetical protein
MQNAEVLREAVRNFCAGVSRPILVLLAVSSIAVITTALQTGGLAGAMNKASVFHKAMASVQAITAEGQINAAACDALSKTGGIAGSGAILFTPESLTAITLPENPIPLAYISDGFLNLLNFSALDMRVNGVYISETVANRLGKKVGERFYLTNWQPVDIRGIYKNPDSGAQTGLGYVILAPTPDKHARFSSCLADIWPYNPSVANILYTTITGDETKRTASEKSQQIELKQVNGKFGSQNAAYSDYRNSPAIITPLFALLLAFFTGIAFARLRRLELTSALHCGVHKLDLLKILVLETLPPLLVCALSSAATFALITFNLTEKLPPEFMLGNFALTALGFILGTSFSLLFTDQKNIFKYFKQR